MFLSQQAPQVFQSENNGNIRTAKDFIDNDSNKAYETGRDYGFTNGDKAPGNINKADNEYLNRSWFDYEGDTVQLRKTGGSFSFARPLNGGDPYKDAKGMCWPACPSQRCGRSTSLVIPGPTASPPTSSQRQDAKRRRHLCVVQLRRQQQPGRDAFRHDLQQLQQPPQSHQRQLLHRRHRAIHRHQQRLTHFQPASGQLHPVLPVNWLKIHKGCRPKPGEEADSQAIGVQIKGGAIMGDAPV